MKIQGYPGLVEGRPGIRYSKGRGWETVRTWTGLYSEARALAGTLKAIGATDVDCPAPGDRQIATVTATFGGADDATPPENRIESTWELDDGESDKSTWKHPKVTAVFAGWSFEDQIVFKGAIDSVLRGSLLTQIQDPTGRVLTVLRGLLEGSGALVPFISRQLRADLQDTFYDPTNVLRHTLSGPQGWRYTFQWDKVALLTNSADIQSSEPSLWFDLPPNRTWLTHKPRIFQRSNGIIDVIREWKEIEYDNWKYNLLSSVV